MADLQLLGIQGYGAFVGRSHIKVGHGLKWQETAWCYQLTPNLPVETERYGAKEIDGGGNGNPNSRFSNLPRTSDLGR